MLVEEFQTFGWIANPSPLLEKGHPSGRLDIYFSLEMSFLEFSLGRWGNGRDKGNVLVKLTLSCIEDGPSPHIGILDLILTLVGFCCVVSPDAIMTEITTHDSEMLLPTSA